MRRTRAARAADLRRMLRDGPSLFANWSQGGLKLTPEEAQAQVKLWLSTWVLPLTEDLIPELREQRDRAAALAEAQQQLQEEALTKGLSACDGRRQGGARDRRTEPRGE